MATPAFRPPSVNDQGPPRILEFPSPNSWCNSLGKRIIDVVVSIVVLLCAFPLFPIVALLIKLTSRGPVLFVHDRVGRYGKPFRMLKFRTMEQTARSSGLALTREGDQRITLVGKYLRKWKLDELPQLLNVIRGDMSIIGPRPHMSRLLAESPELRPFLSLRPGMTGLATMLFRHEESLLPPLSGDALERFYIKHVLPDKIHLELQYAAASTLGADLRILLRTVQQVFSPQQQGEAALLTSQRILASNSRRRRSGRSHRQPSYLVWACLLLICGLGWWYRVRLSAAVASFGSASTSVPAGLDAGRLSASDEPAKAYHVSEPPSRAEALTPFVNNTERKPYSTSRATIPADISDIVVWADSATHLYYCPTSSMYGASRNGQFLSQADAQRASFRPATGESCVFSLTPATTR